MEKLEIGFVFVRYSKALLARDEFLVSPMLLLLFQCSGVCDVSAVCEANDVAAIHL